MRTLLLSLVARAILAISMTNFKRFFSATGKAIILRRPCVQKKPAADMLFGHADIVRGLSPEARIAVVPGGGLSLLEVQPASKTSAEEWELWHHVHKCDLQRFVLVRVGKESPAYES